MAAPTFFLVLRLLTLGALVASIVVLVTNQFTSLDGTKTSFKDVSTYRFVLATTCGGCLYAVIQIPFAVYYAYKGKRLFKSDFLPNFDFYGDKIVAFVLASGVGAGFMITFELKKTVDASFEGLLNLPGFSAEKSKNLKFIDKAYIATALLFLGFLTTALLSVFSSLAMKSTRKGFFG